jgi:hypothetical protein
MESIFLTTKDKKSTKINKIYKLAFRKFSPGTDEDNSIITCRGGSPCPPEVKGKKRSNIQHGSFNFQG